MDGSCYYSRSTAPALRHSPSSPWRLYHDKSWQTNMLLMEKSSVSHCQRGPSHCAFFFFFPCLLLAPDREGKKKKPEWFLSGGEKPAGWRAPRWQRQFAVWLNPHQRSQAVKKSSHTLYRQTDGRRDRVTPDVQKLLSRREDGGLDASMWQCVKNRPSECK